MSKHREKQQERHELQERISRWLDFPLSILAFVMLGLLLTELTFDLSARAAERVAQAGTTIWVVFVLTFLVEFALAPNKIRYLRTNWLTAVSVALPFFRVFRVLRVARALRGLSLLRILTTLNRGARALGTIVRRGQLGYVMVLTLLFTLTSASAVYFFERNQPGAVITSIGQAMWWALTLVTTINSSLEVTTLEARVVGILLRLYAIAVSGYLTAVIATHLLGWASEVNQRPDSAEIEALRLEIAQLRQALQHQRPESAAQFGDDD